ncbi:MAG: hypothetical protein JXR82_09075 [Marinifilaceae bacterium]|nr:hypothetical protein [Marinifilaceae bacterium]
MKNRILLSCFFVILLLVNVFTFLRLKVDRSNDLLNFKKEIEVLNDSFIENQSLNFKIQSKVEILKKKIDFTIDSIDLQNRKGFFLVFIPKDACWNCFNIRFKQFLETSRKYNLHLVIFSNERYVRNLKVYSEENNLSFSIVNFEDNSLNILKSNLLFALYEPDQGCFVPYVEIKGFEVIDQLISNYYENVEPIHE